MSSESDGGGGGAKADDTPGAPQAYDQIKSLVESLCKNLGTSWSLAQYYVFQSCLRVFFQLLEGSSFKTKVVDQLQKFNHNKWNIADPKLPEKIDKRHDTFKLVMQDFLDQMACKIRPHSDRSKIDCTASEGVVCIVGFDNNVKRAFEVIDLGSNDKNWINSEFRIGRYDSVSEAETEVNDVNVPLANLWKIDNNMDDDIQRVKHEVENSNDEDLKQLFNRYFSKLNLGISQNQFEYLLNRVASGKVKFDKDPLQYRADKAISQDVWNEVKNALRSNHETSIKQFTDAQKALVGCRALSDTTLQDQEDNGLRLRMLSKGIEAFAEVKIDQARHDNDSQTLHLLPSYKFCNMLLYYFYFDQDDGERRQKFLAQFSQSILIAMFRAWVPIMNKDIVIDDEHHYYVVVGDGWDTNILKKGNDRFPAFQNKVFAIRIDDSSYKQVELKVTKIRIVTDVDMVQEYGFRLPQCDFTTDGDIRALVQASREKQSSLKIMPLGERIKAAVAYHRAALAMANVLMMSVAFADQYFNVDPDKTHQLVGGGGFMETVQRLWNNVYTLFTTHQEKIQKATATLRPYQEQVQPRAQLPQLPRLEQLIAGVNAINNANDAYRNAQVFVYGPNEGGRTMDDIQNTALAGVTTPMTQLVKSWIMDKQPALEIEEAWRVGRATHSESWKDYLETIIKPKYDNQEDPHKELKDIDDRIIEIAQDMPNIIENFNGIKVKLLERREMEQVHHQRQVSNQLQAFFEACQEHDVGAFQTLDTNIISTSDPRELLDQARKYMVLNVDYASTNHSQFVRNLMFALLQRLFPGEVRKFQQTKNPTDFILASLRVRNYDKEYMKLADVTHPPEALRSKMHQDEGYVAHEHFQKATQRLTGRSLPKVVSSYGYVLQFMNALDGVVASFGSIVSGVITYTFINKHFVGIGYRSIHNAEKFQDSLDSVELFQKRQLWAMVEKQTTDRDNDHLKKWINQLKPVPPDLYGKLDEVGYCPSIRKYQGLWFYSCPWNFPMQILPVTFHNTPNRISKIGCYDCVFYHIGPNQSFGITPQGLTKMLDTLKSMAGQNVIEEDARHLKTNYSMLTARPLSYHLEIMPLMKMVVGNLTRTRLTREMKEALGDPPGNTLEQKLGDLKTWFGKVDNFFNDAAAVFDPASQRIVLNVFYTMFSGCYYVPKPQRSYLGGGDTQGAFVIARDREDVHTNLGERYPMAKLKHFAGAISPIVYSIFFMLNGIMGISGQLTPYIFPDYMAFNEKRREGVKQFASQFAAQRQYGQGYTIDTKLQALGLKYPDTSKISSSSNSQNGGGGGGGSGGSKDDGLSDNKRSLLQSAGLLALYLGMMICTKDTDKTRDEREKCEKARRAMDKGAKHGFRVHYPPQDWERTMKSLPDYFTTKNNKWTDAHEVDRSKIRYDSSGNKIERWNKGYDRGMTIVNGRYYGPEGDRHAKRKIEDLQRQLEQERHTNREKAERGDEKRNRVIGKRFREGGAANLEFKDIEGNTVFRMLPHNIAANVLLLAYAVLTCWGASAGTSSYTRLLDVEFKKASKKLADLGTLQKPRMACSFFFGMGLGIFVAFIASIVEMTNRKRIRQVLFILLMSVPIIVLGAYNIYGSANTCAANPGGFCPVNQCTDNQCTFGTDVQCNDNDNKCPSNDCVNKKCSQSLSNCGPDSSLDTASDAPAYERTRYVPQTTSKFPKLTKFWKSLTGTHDEDIMRADPGASATDLNSDDVLRFNVKASDFMFIGMGCGVLVAGICTILPSNPFHPSRFDVEFQGDAQKTFTTVSSVNPQWWIYALLFSLILAGAGSSSLALNLTTVPDLVGKTTDSNGNDVRTSGTIQSGVALGVAVLLFVTILVLGWWHLKRHRDVGNLMYNYRVTDSSSSGGTAAGHLVKS